MLIVVLDFTVGELTSSCCITSTLQYPTCERSCSVISTVCAEFGLDCQVLHISKLQSVAMRQLRVCIDVRTRKQLPSDLAKTRPSAAFGIRA
jgi:hypothetical protein